MSNLLIFSTARAIRRKLQEYKEKDGFIPKMMRVDEFESKVAVVPNLSLINPTQRVFFLKEASEFDEFERLKSQRDLVKFFSQSDDFFRFFEELSWEMVEIETLLLADSYAEFEEHIDILMQLKSNYQKILESNGFTDKMFIPQSYRINEAFIDAFDSFEVYIDGYLSRFELKLLQEVAKKREVIGHIRTSKYNQKMQERFSDIGLKLPKNSEVVFNLSTKKIVNSYHRPLKIDAKVYTLQSRFEQIATIFGEVEEMVRDGISPENIAVILPDESFVSSFAIYDRWNNYNFAMGFSFSHTLIYRKLKAVSNYQKGGENIDELKFFGIDFKTLAPLSSKKRIDIREFFDSLSSLSIEGLICSEDEALKSIKQNSKGSNLALKYLHFIRLFGELRLSFKEWLYLWLREIETIRVDDTTGGRVTVMGVLETRGVDFEGVVICDFNEGIVPAISTKDRFLNSTVRKFAKLPTKEDRDSLQRHYYTSLMERAKKVVITYSKSDNSIASKFLYELNLPKPQEIKAPLEFLYSPRTTPLVIKNPIVENFKAKNIEWSATKLESWLTCKRKFYYQYIQKIEPQKSDKINSGAILHSTLKRVFEDRSHFLSIEEFRDRVEYELTNGYDSYDSRLFNYYKKLWLELMDNFFAKQIRHFESGWRVVECENSVSGDIEGIRFKGSVDRIDQKGGEFFAIDYKTSEIKNPKKEEAILLMSKFQMNIYNILLNRDFNITGLFFVELFKNGNFQAVNEIERKNELLFNHIEHLKTIDGFEATKCDDLRNCSFCQYRIICERGEFI